MNSWGHKLESEFTRSNNSEQKEKLQLEKHLSEVSSELNKLKLVLKEERGKHVEEVSDGKPCTCSIRNINSL